MFFFVGGRFKNNSPGYIKQAPSRGHKASPQSGLGVGCKLCSSSKKGGVKQAARAGRTCAGAAHKHFSLILCCGFFFPRSCLPRVEVQYRVSVAGRDAEPLAREVVRGTEF